MKYFLVILFFSVSFFAYSQDSDEYLANQYYATGSYEKAAVIYEKLFSKSPSEAYYEPYFNSLLKSKQFEDAEKLTKKLSKQNPDSFIYPIDLARVYQESGRQEKAEDIFNSLLRNLKGNETQVRSLATAFYRAEAYDYSIKALLNGRKLMNDEQAFAFDLLGLYRYRKNKEMLTWEYLNILPSNPTMLRQAEMMLSNAYEDNSDYDFLQAELLKRLQKDPQTTVYAELLTWQYIQKKEFAMALRQTIALDRRLKENGEKVYELTQLLISNKSYETAIEGLKYIEQKGTENEYYIPAKIDQLNARMKLVTSGKYTKQELSDLEAEYNSLLTTLGKKRATVFAIRQLANLEAYYLSDPEKAESLYEELLQLPGLPQSIIGQAKLELGDVYILTGEIWEANLIYGQVEKEFPGETLGQDAKFKNAKLSYYEGDFKWAKAQADVLKSSTSQLIANDALNLSLMIGDNTQTEGDSAALRKFAYADLMLFKNRPDEALKVLDTLESAFKSQSLADDILMSRAKIFIAKNEFQKAAGYLQQITDNYAFDLWGDDAIFMLADLWETKLNDPEKAKKLFEKIITDYPSSLYVVEARKRFRILRGDKIENPT